MKKLLLIFLFATTQLCAQEIPQPVAGSYVHDFANVMSEDERKSLHEKLIRIKDKYTVEVAVITMKTLGDYGIEDYTLKIGREWGVGGKSNNGLIILSAIDDRKWRIEVGPGLQGILTDAGTASMAREKLVPRFKEGNYYQGFMDLMNDIEIEINPETLEIRKAEEEKRRIENEKLADSAISFVLGFLGMAFLVSIALYFWKKRMEHLAKKREELKEAKYSLKNKISSIENLFDLRRQIDFLKPVDKIKREVDTICSQYTDLFAEANRVVGASDKIEEVNKMTERFLDLKNISKEKSRLSEIIKDLTRYNELKFVNIQSDYYKDVIKDLIKINESFNMEDLSEFDLKFSKNYDKIYASHHDDLKSKVSNIDERLREALDNKSGIKADRIYQEYLEVKHQAITSNANLRYSYENALEDKRYIRNFDQTVKNELGTFIALAGLAYILSDTKEETLRKAKGIEEDARSLSRSPESVQTLKKFVDSIKGNFKKVLSEKDKHEEKLRKERERMEEEARREREKRESEERERRRKREEEEEEERRRRRSYESSSYGSSSYNSSSSSSNSSSYSGGSFDGGGSSGSW